MYLQSLVVRVFDVAMGTGGSDRALHHVGVQISFPVEHLAVGLVHRVVHVVDMAYNGISVEDVALLAQLAAVYHVIVS